MNKNLWVTNHFKQIERIKKYNSLERLRLVLLDIKSKKEQNLVYRKRENK